MSVPPADRPHGALRAEHDGDLVVVELQGRIGNQLFQFASGFGIAARRGARLVFTADRVPLDDQLLPELVGEAYVEATRADLLRVGAWVDRGPADRVARAGIVRAARAWRRLRGATPPAFVVWEETARFRPEVFSATLPLRLVGHLQSERYFAPDADSVAATITLPAVDAMFDRDRPSVAVSFRRGDYNLFGWALPLEYYDRALEHVVERVDSPTMVLFGDDPAFVELVAARLRRYGEVVDGCAQGADPIAQLAQMTACDHHIIANSTFAWWGAWLAERRPVRQRIIVAPAEFRGPDRVPERWTTLEAGVRSF